LAVSRIDKFLVSQELDARGRRIEAAPSMRKISDHSPLVNDLGALLLSAHCCHVL
jgi:exonuclease III